MQHCLSWATWATSNTLSATCLTRLKAYISPLLRLLKRLWEGRWGNKSRWALHSESRVNSVSHPLHSPIRHMLISSWSDLGPILVRTARCWSRAREQVANLSVGIFHDAVHPQREIVKANRLRYHWLSSVFGSGWSRNRFLTKPEVSLSIVSI
jgi:hypothetical protein